MILYGMGITQHTTGTDNVKAVANLLMLTGNMGRRGTGFAPLRGQNNVQGACDMGALPVFYPGYQRVDNPEVRKKFEKAWGRTLNEKPGLTITDMIQAAHDGRLKALYVMGENPMLSEPDLNHAREALARLELLVVQDIFLTETAQLADVILPAASFAEKDGTFTSTERRVQLVRKAIDPPGEARADWEIIAEISRRMGYPMNYASSAEIMAEIARLTPIYGGISHDRLDNHEGLQWPCWDPEHPGTPMLHEGQFTRGRGKFHVVQDRPPAELPTVAYPMLLTTGQDSGTLSYGKYEPSLPRSGGPGNGKPRRDESRRRPPAGWPCRRSSASSLGPSAGSSATSPTSTGCSSAYSFGREPARPRDRRDAILPTSRPATRRRRGAMRASCYRRVQAHRNRSRRARCVVGPRDDR